MAEALFVTTKDMATFTPMNGNIDVDNLIQYMKIGQDIHILNYLGSDLYNKINDDIVASTLTGDYLTLVNTYIKPMVIWYGFYEYLKFAPYSVSNLGIFKHLSENSESVDDKEIDNLEDKAFSVAENYAQRFVRHMCFNSTTFPEYTSNTDDDVRPDKDVNFTNWFL